MGRISKIRRLDLEREVMELRQKGFGPQTIAKALNERHNLKGADEIIFTNVYNFLQSVPKAMKDAITEEHVEQYYIQPLNQMKTDLNDLHSLLLPKAKAILSQDKAVLTKDEVMSLQTFLRHWEELFDRIAKVEGILNPSETIKAKNVIIIHQFNAIKELVNEIVGSCESCREKFLVRLDATTAIVADV